MYVDGYIFFFFKQKTAYDMRISDWSSDGCSSDLLRHLPARAKRHPKPFGQICASAKIEYGRAAVVQPLAQRSIVRFGPRLPLLNSPQLPVLRAGDRKKIRQEPRAISGRCCKPGRSEEHTSELQSLMTIPYSVFCLK